MCGIAGVFEFRPGAVTAPNVLESMAKMIEHRGPDQGAVFQDGPIGLVARRLRIIDLSPAGSQPIPNEDGTIQLVYNGEIFNHEPLRKELQALGHRFRGRCDSEVVVHAYEAWGPRCVERFRGFFAFALWDSVRGELLLARDRIGIKPLYYAWSDDRLVFGSEIKAILEHPDVPRAMDLQSMYHYLGYEFVPGPATMFRGIAKLPPGTLARVRGGRLEVEPYWELRFEDALVNEQAAVESQDEGAAERDASAESPGEEVKEQRAGDRDERELEEREGRIGIAGHPFEQAREMQVERREVDQPLARQGAVEPAPRRVRVLEEAPRRDEAGEKQVKRRDQDPDERRRDTGRPASGAVACARGQVVRGSRRGRPPESGRGGARAGRDRRGAASNRRPA